MVLSIPWEILDPPVINSINIFTPIKMHTTPNQLKIYTDIYRKIIKNLLSFRCEG